MITGPIESQIDQIWNAFWSGGISNPIEVIEQITYLLFLRLRGTRGARRARACYPSAYAGRPGAAGA
jgi:hypothetical protein